MTYNSSLFINDFNIILKKIKIFLDIVHNKMYNKIIKYFKKFSNISTYISVQRGNI
nr:MAG TPA: hypothetical protein [Caudoviricetes sp.]